MNQILSCFSYFLNCVTKAFPTLLTIGFFLCFYKDVFSYFYQKTKIYNFFRIFDVTTSLSVRILIPDFSNPRPVWLEATRIISMKHVTAISKSFFTELLIVLFRLLFDFISRWCVLCILNLSERRESIYEQTCWDILEEYFEGNLELLSFIKTDTCSFEVTFNCNLSNEKGVNRFANFYTKGETREIQENR